MAKFISIGIPPNGREVTINIDKIISIERNLVTNYAIIILSENIKYYPEIIYDDFIKLEGLIPINKPV
jgi:hypothetical protein